MSAPRGETPEQRAGRLRAEQEQLEPIFAQYDAWVRANPRDTPQRRAALVYMERVRNRLSEIAYDLGHILPPSPPPGRSMAEIATMRTEAGKRSHSLAVTAANLRRSLQDTSLSPAVRAAQEARLAQVEQERVAAHDEMIMERRRRLRERRTGRTDPVSPDVSATKSASAQSASPQALRVKSLAARIMQLERLEQETGQPPSPHEIARLRTELEALQEQLREERRTRQRERYQQKIAGRQPPAPT